VNDFLAMGGYAQYVWGAYSISLIVLVSTVWLTRRNLAATRQRVARFQLSRSENGK
jgi:heme exporter protein CcmD